MAGEYLGEVARFLAEGPLYIDHIAQTGVEPPYYLDEVFPKTISLDCQACKIRTVWARTSPTGNGQVSSSSFLTSVFQCRNCQERQFRAHFWWYANKGIFTYYKIGQFPKFEISPPDVLAKSLTAKNLELYKKGKTLRHHGYGLGALIYFRRLVEDTTNEMLDLLANALKELEGDPAIVERVIDAKKARAFEDKVRVAADVLPKHLRPGGVNPFSVLYEQVSRGIHNLDDKECCAVVDTLDHALTFVFKELKAHVEERKSYIESMKKLSAPKK